MTTGITAKKLVRGGGIILLFIVIFGYGILKAGDIIFGIKLTVVGISDGMQATEPILSFGGTAKRAKAITVDGRIVPAAQDGTWKDTIALLPGYNVVTISTTDKFGRTTLTRYRVFYDAPLIPPVILPTVTPDESDTTPQVDGKETSTPSSPSGQTDSSVQ